MDKLSQRKQITDEAKKRVKAMTFGDPVTNICAGEGNPTRLGYFVDFVTKSHTNKYGVVHREYLAKCTDKKGKFWNACIDVIYPGHLGYDESMELFEPIHAVLFS